MTRNKIASRPAVVRLILVLVAGVAAGCFCSNKLVTVGTDSIGKFVMWRSGDREARQDRFILFKKSHPLLDNGKEHLLSKRIGCAPGQRLEVVQRRYFCDGTSLGVAKTHSLTGIPVDNFIFHGVIPANKLFVVGNSIDSLDSKYYGFIDTSDVISYLIPIF